MYNNYIIKIKFNYSIIKNYNIFNIKKNIIPACHYKKIYKFKYLKIKKNIMTACHYI